MRSFTMPIEVLSEPPEMVRKAVPAQLVDESKIVELLLCGRHQLAS